MIRHLKGTVLWFVFLFAASQVSASPPISIRVGVYSFPPVAMVDQNNKATGLLGDLLAELEKQHSNLSFQVIHTSPKRRQMDFNSGLFDVMFFEHPSWSWEQAIIRTSAPILQVEEVYVALNKDDRDQSFFENLSERQIVAIAGYHYGFANQETDSGGLQEQFNIELSHSHQRNMDLIRADRPSIAEVAVVSSSFHRAYFLRFPEHRNDFLISEKADQIYELGVITRKDGPVSVQTIEDLLGPLIESGFYQSLVEKYGLTLPGRLRPSP